MPKRLEDKIDAEDWFARADSFLLSNRVIETLHMEVVAACTQGVVVCGSCAVELYLKVLAQLERDTPPLHGHDLKELAHDLTGPSYRRLERAWLKECAPVIKMAKEKANDPQWAGFPTEFRKALAASAKAFIKWRYGEAGIVHGWYLGQITNELRNIILELKPDWRPSDRGRALLDPKTNLAKPKDEQFLRPMDWSILNNKPAAFDFKIGRGPKPKDGGSG